MTENQKLGSKAFNDEFLAQLILMSLPCDSTWELLAVALLQLTSDTNLLTSMDMTLQLMQEYCHLEGTDVTNPAMLATHHSKSNVNVKY